MRVSVAMVARSLFCVQVVLTVCLLHSTVATHFRFGLITYDQVSPSTTGTDFILNMQQAWRWSAFSKPALNASINIIGLLYDGTNWVSNLWIVNAINPPNDWFVATWIPTRVTYNLGTATERTFTASTFSCCRISTLLNNRDGVWSHSAAVYVKKNSNFRSMKTSMVPITTLILNRLNTFQINVLTYQNEILSFRMANNVEAAYGNAWIPPSNATVQWNTGVINWAPTQAGLWTIQVIIMGNQGQPSSVSDTSKMQSFFGLDWILQVIDPTVKVCKRFCGNPGSFCSSDSGCYSCNDNMSPARAPFCDLNSPPYFTTVTIGSTVTNLVRDTSNNINVRAAYQTTFTVTIQIVDDDAEDYIFAGTAAIPAGASYTQQSTNEGSNTVVFTWSPGDNDLGGSVVCFTATDSIGQNTVGSLCLVITVDQGSLRIYGDGASNAIAGTPTAFIVQNSRNRTHSLTLQGVTNTVNGAVSTTGPTGTNADGQSVQNYTSSYTLNEAGLYVLTVADTTPSIPLRPQNAVNVLTVIPNITLPSATVVYEQGSSGLTGGTSGTTLSFYLRAFDSFGNRQSLQRTDQFYFVLSYVNSIGKATAQTINMVWDPISAGGTVDYRYNGSYISPSLGLNQENYTISIYFKFSSMSSAVFIRNYTAIVVVTPFTLSLSSPTFIAGKPISFSFLAVDLSDSQAESKAFSASISDVQATITYVSGTQFNFTCPGTIFTKAGVVSNGIVISAAGLGDVLSTTGSLVYDYTVENDIPDSTQSSIVAADPSIQVSEIEASEEAVTLVIILQDQYGNPCKVGNYQVAYSVKVNGIQMASGITKRSSSYSEYFYFEYIPNTAGPMEIDAMVTFGQSNVVINTLKGFVVPGVFSVSQSEVSPSSSSARDTVAGVDKSLTVNAKDYLRNPRNIDGDTFNATFSRLKFGIKPLIQTKIDPEQSKTDPAEYKFSYNSQRAGASKIDIAVERKGTNRTFSPFVSLPLTVWAGKLNQTSVIASNANDVKRRTRAEIAIQSQDMFGNVIEDLSGGRYLDSDEVPKKYDNFTQSYIVEVLSVNGLDKKLYRAGYCPPSAVEPLKCATSYLQKKVDDEEDNDSEDLFDSDGVKRRKLSDIDKTLISDGFFRVFYRVPRRNFGNGTYTVRVYLLNSQQSGSLQEWEEQIQHESTKLVKVLQFNVLPEDETNNDAQQFTYMVVFGAASGCFFVAGMGYGAFRLSRYRPKYKAEKLRADENEQVLAEMRDETNLAGGRDYIALGAANVTANPLHQIWKQEGQLRQDFLVDKNPTLALGSSRNHSEGDDDAPRAPTMAI